jgi:hypothetical protein
MHTVTQAGRGRLIQRLNKDLSEGFTHPVYRFFMRESIDMSGISRFPGNYSLDLAIKYKGIGRVEGERERSSVTGHEHDGLVL